MEGVMRRNWLEVVGASRVVDECAADLLFEIFRW